MNSDEQASAGDLIRGLSDRVNQLEAVSVRIKCGQATDLSDIVASATSLFPEVLESCGLGKVKLEEVILIADTCLNLCRVGLSLVPLALSGAFTANSAALLCVLLTGPYASHSRLFNSISERCMRFMELLDPTDPNASSLWQCFIKVIAKDGNSDEQVRINSVCLLIRHCARISQSCQTQDLSKWFQYTKALLKLNKHVLRRNSLPEQSIKDVALLLKMVPWNDVLEELINLPACKAKHDESLGDVSKYLRDQIYNLKLSPPADSIGSALLRSSSPADRLNDLFTLTPGSLVAAKLWLESPPKGKFNGLEIPSCLDLCWSKWTTSGEEKWSLAVSHMSMMIFNLSGVEEGKGHVEYSIIKCILRRLLFKKKVSDLKRYSFVERLIIVAHLQKESLHSIWREEFRVITDLIGKLLKIQELDSRLLLWPLAAIINICAECPQPSTCHELRQISKSILMGRPLHSFDRLSNLCAKAFIVSLKFCEATELTTLMSTLTQISPKIVLNVVGHLPLTPSFNAHDWSAAIERLFIDGFPPLGSTPPTIAILKSCELYLRFATDITIFEKPLMNHVQVSLVSFLQRDQKQLKDHEPSIAEFLKNQGKGLCWILSPPPIAIPKEGPTSTCHSILSPELEGLLSSLEEAFSSLKGKSDLRNAAIARLQEIIQTCS